MMEQCGDIGAREAKRWKEGIYGLMLLWGLEPDEVIGAELGTRSVRRDLEDFVVLAGVLDDLDPDVVAGPRELD